MVPAPVRLLVPLRVALSLRVVPVVPPEDGLVEVVIPGLALLMVVEPLPVPVAGVTLSPDPVSYTHLTLPTILLV